MAADGCPQPEHSFSLNANLRAHVPEDTGDKPYIQVRIFIQALESCATFLSDWASWQMKRKASHQSVSLARSLRMYLLNPLQESVLRIRNSDSVEKYQAECDAWREALPYLFRVINACIPRAQGCCIVYTTLYEHLDRVPDDSLAFSILCKTWKNVLRILANQVRRAILDGEIDDFYSEFFIEEIERAESRPNTSVKLPFQRYRVVGNRLPKFISSRTAENVLFALHAVDCNSILRHANIALASSQSEWEKKAVSAHEISNTFQRLALYPQRSCLILEGASVQWRKNAASALSEHLPVGKIRVALSNLRAFLLLGDELFWRSFFDELRLHEEIFDEETQTHEKQARAERILNNILISLYTEHGSSQSGPVFGSTEDVLSGDSILPLALKINSAGSVIPEYALNETESILLAAAAPVYCDIFSIAFSVRRVGCELQKCFQTIMLLSRLNRKSRTAELKSAGMVRARAIHYFSLLRLRMAVVIDALEYYVQCVVVQPQYEKLDGILERSMYESGKRTPGRAEAPLFDRFTAAQDASVRKITDQCLLRNDLVTKRYHEIFSSCLSFCAIVDKVLNEEEWPITTCMQNTQMAERTFSRNVTLLGQLLEKTNASCIDSTVCELQRQLEEVARFAS